MTIYILDSNPDTNAKLLDDRSLNSMIKAIAQVLCNVHHKLGMDRLNTLGTDNRWEDTQKFHKIPLNKTFLEAPGAWADWARECRANYLYLVELGRQCYFEFTFRHSTKLNLGITKHHLSEWVIDWAADNVPSNLPFHGTNEVLGVESFVDTKDFPMAGGLNYTVKESITSFPLVMPKKFIYGVNYNGFISDHQEESEFLMNSAICSYRNYYQAKLKGRKCPRNCEYGRAVKANILGYFVCERCNGHGYIRGKWTRRDKPEWMEI